MLLGVIDSSGACTQKGCGTEAASVALIAPLGRLHLQCMERAPKGRATLMSLIRLY